MNTALLNNDQTRAAEMAQNYLDKMNNIRLNVAIAGESGVGKSTLVNALRGIKNKTKGAAETTMEPTEYPHPEMPNIILSDLPGISTTYFEADKYLEQVGFEKFDFFIVVSSERFTENDARLAKKNQEMKKQFYFMRSKVDHNIRDTKEEDPNTKEDVLNIIRNDCTQELQRLGLKSPKVFLVSGFRLDLYEFEDLRKTQMEELPEHQKDALLLALPNTSLESIKQKRKTLEKKIILFTIASAGVAAVPVAVVSAGVNLSMTVAFTVHCCVSLGLVALAICGVKTYKVLKFILNPLTDDAQRVFKKAWF